MLYSCTAMAIVLLEIGTEEMPAHYIPAALDQLAGLAGAVLQAERIAFDSVSTWGTPRRLALVLQGVPLEQAASVREVRGPSVEAAFAANGMPTQAAIGFARSQGLTVNDLRIKELDGGEFLVAGFHDTGRPTSELLPAIFPRLITGLTFPHTMRWGAGELTFARPIRWIVALLDDQVIPFTLGTVTSGRSTRGHRFLAPGEVAIPSAESYRPLMEENHVLVVPAERREAIREQLESIAEQDGALVVDDGSLLEETVFHVEYPTAVRCHFDESFLSLPPDVLIHVLRREQQFFPLKTPEDSLIPGFIAVRDGDKAYLGNVRAGFETVARAKLLDALYFFEQDIRRPLAERIEDLRGIVFQEQLGTMHDKALRLQALAGRIAERLDFSSQQRMLAERAALLCKADLATALGNEHPELRGTLGGAFARRTGEPDAVATGMVEQYHPINETDAIPASAVGRVVALADKLDTVAGCFAVGLAPVVDNDPFHLRANALGVIRILAEANFRLDVPGLVKDALALLPHPAAPLDETRAVVVQFLRGMYDTALQVEGFAPAVRHAVLAVTNDLPADALQRARVITRHLGDPAFIAVARTAARLANTARQAPEGEEEAPAVPAARELLAHYRELASRAEFFALRGEFSELPALYRELLPDIDRFFAETADPALRPSRPTVARQLTHLFLLLGDLAGVVK